MSAAVTAPVARVTPRLPALTPVEARHAWDAGAIVIDIRPAAERLRDGGLPGVPALAPDQVAELDLSEESTVVLVCTDGHCSDRLAGVLHRRGFGNVTTVAGGFRSWLTEIWRQWAELLVCEPDIPPTRFARLISHGSPVPTPR
ncbi:MAG TPA: rhodanese-like domain-containing protein [Microlunatus sp.]|nr:rhodanese-like domain-containing protein [Microlunatus sp.]